MKRIGWDLADYIGWVCIGYFLLIVCSVCGDASATLMTWAITLAVLIILKNRLAEVRTMSLQLLGVYAGTAVVAAYVMIWFGSGDPTPRQHLTLAGILLLSAGAYAAGGWAGRLHDIR